MCRNALKPRKATCDIPAKKRRNRGFTLMETMIVVMIIAIVGALAFISITNIMKNAQQEELDGTAREIYIAAQNHLTQADSQNVLSRKPDKGVEISDGIYCYAVSGTDPRLDRTNSESRESVLYQMLPYGAIDETVRTDGTYVIEYDLESATVLGVFYARSSYSSAFAANTDGFAFTDSDISLLFEDPGYTGDDKKSDRRTYASASGATVMVGYYGGEDLDVTDRVTLDKPKLEVINAERLTAIVKNTNFHIDRDRPAGEAIVPTLQLVITGKTSGEVAIVKLHENRAPVLHSFTTTPDGGETFYVFLDDITQEGGHFTELFPDFIPGEDVEIQAVTMSTHHLANIASSAKLTRNSLFDGFGTDLSDDGKFARIANVRHLENLSESVSGYDPSDAAWGADATARAVQTRDLSWTAFQLAVETSASIIPQPMLIDEETQARADTVTVHELDGAHGLSEGSFAPIDPAFVIEYDGAGHKLSDMRVETSSGDAGIFSSLVGASISDVVVESPRMSASSGRTGGLVGYAEDTDISGVLVTNARRTGSDAGYEVSASGSAGGIVGELSGGSVEKSSASVYVKSTGGNAGGLIGTASSSASLSLSYSGGHTSQGRYLESTEAGQSGRVNVLAYGSAGGLVGEGSVSVSDCYSAASAHGAYAGGLAGKLSGTASNCYSVGAVSSGGGYAGALVGDGTSATLTGCRYVEMPNEGMSVCGAGTSSATAVDDSTESYASFSATQNPAYPYDSTLMSSYQGKYPYPTIAVMAGSGSGTLPFFLSSHHGDWPDVETMTVNTRN